MGDDLGLITRRIEAASTGKILDRGGQDEAVRFRNPTDLPEIMEACEILIEHLKSIRGSIWLAATRLRVWMTPSWKRAWAIKEEAILTLVESSQSRRMSSSHREMVDETFTYIAGGHETTQKTTKWSMKYLTANQGKQSKLRDTLLKLFPDPYLDASTRRTTQDVVVLGHRIPAGVDVFSAPSIQSYEDMDDFVIDPALQSPTSKQRETGPWRRGTKGLYQPEHWIDTQGNYNGYAGPMIPFGAGPRGCFGQRLARMELRIMIVMLVLSFEFKLISDAYASFRAAEIVNRGPQITYIRPVLRV
ncbi:cytochrome P450 [Durotheca rogersii]|uniref:cytochrome P450 n=1 Tax=Durotheca rogersii TaxID=419775 RepID=UPI0022203204|nr:cytochrome P450 [Durotheca rogersii]KAI5853649.1 cytochrome P450 [Durotheca rogersii]